MKAAGRIQGTLAGIIAALAMAMFSCSPEACLENTESYLNASLYSYSKKTISAPDSLTIHGYGLDTNFIYNRSRNITVARLPLDTEAGISTFVITFNNIADTITFRHTSYPHLISRECGYTWYHDTEPPEWTSNAIDSVWFRFGLVTNNEEENIRIFY
jgi:hypothetical protein